MIIPNAHTECSGKTPQSMSTFFYSQVNVKFRCETVVSVLIIPRSNRFSVRSANHFFLNFYKHFSKRLLSLLCLMSQLRSFYLTVCVLSVSSVCVYERFNVCTLTHLLLAQMFCVEHTLVSNTPQKCLFLSKHKLSVNCSSVN